MSAPTKDVDGHMIKWMIKTIHENTNHQYAESGLVPVSVAAKLILDVWRTKDREIIQGLKFVETLKAAIVDYEEESVRTEAE